MMKRIVSVLLLLCLALSFSACAEENGRFFKFWNSNDTENERSLYTSSRLDLFDTRTLINGYEENEADFKAVIGEINPILEKYHRLFDIYYEYTEFNNLRTVNKNAGKEIEVPAELIEFLEYAKEVYVTTNGKTNIALGSVLSIWHEYREQGLRVPELSLLEEAAKHTDIEKLVINKENSSVTLLDDKMSLDVGALAKGYIAEKVASLLQEKGKTGYLISLGGNVRTVGTKPNGENWTLAVESPSLDGSYICKLEAGQTSLVTSGDYQRFYTVDGKNYNHIIDPSTLYPAEYFTLVSVMTPDSALADALSTALFCMPLDEGKKLVASLENTHAVWLLKDGTTVFSDGMERYIK